MEEARCRGSDAFDGRQRYASCLARRDSSFVIFPLVFAYVLVKRVK